MYETYFGFAEAPFQLTTDPKFLYLSTVHKESYEQIVYGLRRKYGFIVLTGEAGTGKSILMRAVSDALESNMLVGLIRHGADDARQLLCEVCDALGVDSSDASSRNECLRRIEARLRDLHTEHRHAVLVIDDAHELRDETLASLHDLVQLEIGGQQGLQLCLAGQPELLYLLENPRFRQLNQRVALRLALQNLNIEETAAYIRHRLEIAGASSAERLYNYEAIQRIYAATKGVPRRINILCENGLILAHARGAAVVSGAIISAVTLDPVKYETGQTPAPPEEHQQEIPDPGHEAHQGANTIYNPGFANAGPNYTGPEIFTDETSEIPAGDENAVESAAGQSAGKNDYRDGLSDRVQRVKREQKKFLDSPQQPRRQGRHMFDLTPNQDEPTPLAGADGWQPSNRDRFVFGAEKNRETAPLTSVFARQVSDRTYESVRDFLDDYAFFRKPASLVPVVLAGFLTYVIAILAAVLILQKLSG